jgi:hypothetical protein
MPTVDDELSDEEGSLAEPEWDHRLPRDDPIHGCSTFTLYDGGNHELQPFDQDANGETNDDNADTFLEDPDQDEGQGQSPGDLGQDDDGEALTVQTAVLEISTTTSRVPISLDCLQYFLQHHPTSAE